MSEKIHIQDLITQSETKNKIYINKIMKSVSDKLTKYNDALIEYKDSIEDLQDQMKKLKKDNIYDEKNINIEEILKIQKQLENMNTIIENNPLSTTLLEEIMRFQREISLMIEGARPYTNDLIAEWCVINYGLKGSVVYLDALKNGIASLANKRFIDTISDVLSIIKKNKVSVEVKNVVYNQTNKKEKEKKSTKKTVNTQIEKKENETKKESEMKKE